MDTSFILELIGYLASLLVAISLMMSNIVRLRILNLIGSFTFTIYGALIDAWPVAFMNALIVGINIYYLNQMRSRNEFFKWLRVNSDGEFLRYTLSFHQSAIRENQPEFDFVLDAGDISILVLRDTIPAGILVGRIAEPGVMQVRLDFVPPAYRDFKIGSFLWSDHRQDFIDLGVHTIDARPGNDEHQAYLKKMGFKPSLTGGVDGDHSVFRLTLK
jgi:hypothetical protein